MVLRVVAGLLVLWCALGAAATVGALTGPGVWWNADPAQPRTIVGLPLRGAAETAAIRALLSADAASAGERWLVVFPPGSDAQVLTYIRYQLAHLEYPRRIDVAADGLTPASARWTGVIMAPGLQPGPGWRRAGEHAGFTRHTVAGS